MPNLILQTKPWRNALDPMNLMVFGGLYSIEMYIYIYRVVCAICVCLFAWRVNQNPIPLIPREKNPATHSLQGGQSYVCWFIHPINCIYIYCIYYKQIKIYGI